MVDIVQNSILNKIGSDLDVGTEMVPEMLIICKHFTRLIS
jgi:hypothetical protein